MTLCGHSRGGLCQVRSVRRYAAGISPPSGRMSHRSSVNPLMRLDTGLPMQNPMNFRSSLGPYHRLRRRVCAASANSAVPVWRMTRPSILRLDLLGLDLAVLGPK